MHFIYPNAGKLFLCFPLLQELNTNKLDCWNKENGMWLSEIQYKYDQTHDLIR